MAALEKFVRAQRVRQLPVLPGDQQNAAHPQFAPPPFLLRELLYATAFLLALIASVCITKFAIDADARTNWKKAAACNRRAKIEASRRRCTFHNLHVTKPVQAPLLMRFTRTITGS
jgi:hypothetical protein